jgi:uncharacterized repeat protein (TIGR03803 family)
MKTLNLSRNLAAHPCAGYLLALFTMTGWLAASAHAGVVFTNLYSFTGTNDGAYPLAGLVQGSDGYLYGTTENEGGSGQLYVAKLGRNFYTNVVYGYGTVFKISTNGALTTLYSFGTITNANGDTLDGGYPEAGLVQGSDGNFYGTTTLGVNHISNDEFPDTVFKISTNGVLTTLIEGIGNPLAALIQGSDGYLYGTTSGASEEQNEFGTGTAFRITTNGVLTYLDYFRSGTSYPGGFDLQSALVQGRDGNLYGTTSMGGTDETSPNEYGDGEAGAVFQISTNGTLAILYSFTNEFFSGYFNYNSGLMQGKDGSLYGTTYSGMVFKISTNGAFTNLHSFMGNDGRYPEASLVQGSDGSLYGTTEGGGTNDSGTVFKINPDGTGFTTLHTFAARGSTINTNSDGAFPQASLILVGNTLYGTTSQGGPSGFGTVFSLTLPGPQLTLTPSFGNIILSWPTNVTGFTLESATNLGPSAIWNANSTVPIVIGGQNVVTNPINDAQMFFRLTQ